jgi:hypothetical protein
MREARMSQLTQVTRDATEYASSGLTHILTGLSIREGLSAFRVSVQDFDGADANASLCVMPFKRK